MRVVQVITAASAKEWDQLAPYIDAQPAGVRINVEQRTITTTIDGPVADTATGPRFDWQLVQTV